MMRKVQLLFWGMIIAVGLKGQEFSLSAAYQYSYSAEWDKAIQRYNFARPFMDDAQPLLIHGAYLGASYFFTTDKKWNSGLKSSYSLTRSSADNVDKLAINLHQFHLGYSLNYKFEGSLDKLRLETDITAISTLLSKRVNNEIELIDDEKNRTFGIGISVGLTILYRIEISDKSALSPFLSVEYSPYLRSPESESILDPSISTFGTGDIRLLNWRLGVRFTFLKS